MVRVTWWTLVISSTCGWFVSVVLADCPYLECFCGDSMILCHSRNFTVMPRLVSNNTDGIISLNLNDNQIKFIPAGSLPPNLQDITIMDNPLSEIDLSAFDGSISTLTSIYFSNTNLVKIPTALGRLKALSFLSISGASIKDWNDDVMRNLGQTLQSLELENVGLTLWPTWIQYFSRLSDFTFAGMRLPTLPDDAMESVANSLVRLTLYGNNLTSIPSAFSKLRKLQELFLYQNEITDVTWLPSHSPLITLSISDNRVTNATHLSQCLLPFAGTLTFLDIDKNRLTTIPDFSFLSKVGNLDFSFNRIYDPIPGSFSPELNSLSLSHNLFPAVPRVLTTLYSVTNIYLAYNSIQLIQSTDFHNQTNYIDVSYNQISQLTDSSFPPNSSIMYLQLNNNPLSQISNVALSNLPNLAELNLQNTLITRLPLGLAFLTKLITFDVSNCTRLVCTCQEKSLQSWIRTIRPEGVQGGCGVASVYDFLAVYSQSCP